MPAVDLDLVFAGCKTLLLSGWHQQSTLQELMINMDKWNSLSETQKSQIEVTCGDNMRME